MFKLSPYLLVIAVLSSCIKDTASSRQRPPLIVTDTLMVYQSNNSSGNRGIFSKSFNTGEVTLLVANAQSPYVSNQRMVYIKAGKTLSYSRLNGVFRHLIDLNKPSYPCLSIDTRLIGVVDSVANHYELLLLDTLGNKTLLFESPLEIKQLDFSSTGQLLFFSQKTTEGNFTLYKIPVAGGNPIQLLTPSAGVEYTDCAATADKLFFLQRRIINDSISTEICSINFDGTDFRKNTDFSLNWSQAGCRIEHLRKVNNSSLIFISDKSSTNKEIFVAKTENLMNPTRMTFTEEFESFPGLLPEFVRDF